MEIKSKPIGSYFIDLNLLGLQLAWEGQLAMSNNLGLAWWARVETCQPNVIYWFGPFLAKRSLKSSLNKFLVDLSGENPSKVTYSLLRSRCMEPYTNVLRSEN